MSRKISGIVMIIMAVTLIFAGCNSNTGQPAAKLGVALSNEVFNSIKDIQSTIDIDGQSIQGINDLGYVLPRQIYEQEQENVIFSPLSLSCAMAMLADGAEGETKQEIVDTLGSDSEQYNTT